jgi:hypothetical protein
MIFKHGAPMPKTITLLLALSLLIVPLTLVGCGRPQLGMPQMTFCEQFVDKVAQKMPMPYEEFIKYTNGEGQPSGLDTNPDPYRHWDGMAGETRTSSLNVMIVREQGKDWVKGGMVTCPEKKVIQFGEWK